ncbi:neuroblast differentiation-associated protein AHNAK-like [Rhincodon typus]|uniref:neuroblast differentiation-associated protein AHNAK-like n=1 Tax=Rhincodon typus TaxID=259920 RepID=UPI0009A30F1A|nr:neuroblast differentiation-associated protein AHNAK-like [Rhincodon typus]XP_048474251.1 neuroblast differentiation-associated protein AHNAK-like [Rhincodon typus]XP_048474252.1 neuroblast differentiation-associated protein AHNAK-like [Rhincodon typus]XP_048474253.1 neuroblast differentiation-associated protein AHNAK-like [Rhincodon typus]XP_048474254.1 neuroblast differentiation-associated protein AHNAK-like [Rhincodon typus]XP_048474255.1 neuroblast differentiation-associated protein AHNA
MESVVQGGVTKELKMSEMVELIVETAAEARVTGFSVSGGGKEGIFIKEVLKDSRAAKALNLKEGDQLLSAKVFFDNAKYEDVLKILQSAEPYKVAFCLKRTVPSADVAISSETGSIELKGPEAKKTKLSIKSISPVKKTKRLMKGKVLSKEEADVELDVPVDVEFAFPKFSTFKRLTITSPKEAAALKGDAKFIHPEAEAELTLGESQVKDKKRKLKFPGFWTGESGKAKLDILEPPKEKGAISVKKPQVTTKELEGTGVEVKAGAKVPALEFLSEKRKGKVDVPTSKSKTELKVSGGADVSAEGEIPEGKLILGLPAKTPQVEIDIGLPKAQIDVKGPSVEDEASAKGPGFKLKMPSFGLKDSEAMETTGPAGKVEKRETEGEVAGPEDKLKMPQISMPSIDISVPKLKQTEELDMPKRGVEVVVGTYKTEGLEGRVKEFAHKIKTFDVAASNVKVPDIDISLPKGRADVSADVKAAKFEGEIQKSKIGIEGPEVKLKIPKVSLPDFGISVKDEEGGEVEVEGPDVKGPVLKIPKFEVSLPKMKLGEAEVDGSPPTAEARVKVPVSEVQVSKAKADIKGPQVEGGEAKIKLPSMKMPTIDITAPKVTIPDVHLPTAKVEVSAPGITADLKTPKVSIGGPRVDGQGPEESSEGFDLKMKMPKVSLPKFDISVGGKEAEAKVDGKLEVAGEDAKFKGMKIPKFEVSLPKMKHAEAETELPAEAAVSGPGLDLIGKLPSIKMPTIDISAPEIKMPEMNVHLLTEKAEVSVPAVEGGVKPPKVGIGAPKIDKQPSELTPEALDLQLKMPKVSLPSFGLSSSSKEVAGEMSGPEVDVKGKLPSVKMPTIDISAPEVKIPELDIDVCLPKEKGETAELAVRADAKVPGVGFKSPKVAGESKVPGITPGGTDATFQMPKVSFPKFEISLKSKDGREDIDVKAKEGLDVEDPDGRVKSPQLKMPKLAVALPKMKSGEVDITGPTIEADTKTDKRDAKISKGKVEVEGVGSSKDKLKLPSMKMPSIDIPTFQMEGLNIDISLPSVKSKPAAEGDLKSDRGSIEGAEAKLKIPKVSLPNFASKSKVDTEADGSPLKGDGKASPPEAKGKVQVKGKSLDIGIKGPSVDVDVDDVKLKGKEGKLKMPKFKMPTFGTPKKYEEGVDIATPDVETHTSKGKLKVKGAEVETGTPKGKGRISKFGISGFKSKSLDAEVSLSSDTKLSKGKVEMKDPSASMKAPKVDISTKAPDQSTGAPDIKLKIPSFSMPSIGILGSKAEADKEVGTKATSGTFDAEAESKLKMPNIQMPAIEISVPQVRQADAEGLLPRAEVDVSEVDLKTYGGDLKIPKVKGEAQDSEGKQKVPLVKMPSIDISLPKVKAPDVDLSLSVPKVDASGRKVEGEATLLSSEPEDGEFKLKMPKIGMPKIGIFESKEKETGVDILATTDYHIGDPEGKGIMFKTRMPKVDLSLPKVKPSEADIEMDASLLEGEGLDAEGKFKMPAFALPKFSPPKMVAPELDLNIPFSKDKKVASEATGPKTDTQTAGGEFQIKIPQVSLPSFGISSAEATSTGVDIPIDKAKPKGKIEVKTARADGGTEVESPEGKTKGGKIKMPKLQISTPKTKAEGDVSAAKEVAKSDTETEGGILKLSLPKFGISPKSTEMEANLEQRGLDGNPKESKAKASMFGISLGKGHKGEGNASLGVSGVTEGDFEASGGRKSDKFKIKMPSVTIPSPKADIDFGRASPKGKVTDQEAKAAVKEAGGFRVKGEIQAQDVSSESPESPFKMPKLRMPDFSISSKKGGDVTAEMKEMSERDTRRSKVEVDLEGPEAEADGKLQMLKMKMPKVEIGLPGEDSDGTRKAEGKVGVDARQIGQEPSEEISAKGFFKMPTVEISTPKIRDSSAGVEGSATEIGLHQLGGRGGPPEGDADVLQLRMPKIELPSFGLLEPKKESQEQLGDRSSTGATVGSSVSKTKIDIQGPQVTVKGLQVEMEATGAELDTSESRLSKLKGKMSKFGVELPKVTQQEEVKVTSGAFKAEGTAKGSYTSLKADVDLSDAELTGSEAKTKTDKARKQLLGFGKAKVKGKDLTGHLPEGDIKTSSPKAKGQSKSPSAKEDIGVGIPSESDSAVGKVKMPSVKMPSFGISLSKSKTVEVNGGLEADRSTRKGEAWGFQTARKKAAGAEESDDTDSSDGKSKMKLKLPKISFTPVKIPTVDVALGGPDSPVAGKPGDASSLHVNGEGETAVSQGMMGKIKLPKVEFSSPYLRAKDGDYEQSLQLVKTEMSVSKDDAGAKSSSGPSPRSSSPRVNGEDAKGKGLKITFSGLQKKIHEGDGEPDGSNLVTSTARTELVLLESSGDARHTKTNKSKSIMSFTSSKSKGMYSVQGTASGLSDSGNVSKLKSTTDGRGEEKEESEMKDKSTKFKLPKFSLGPKSKGVLDVTTTEYENNVMSELQLEDDESTERHFKFQMPKVGFTTVYHEEHISEEKIFEGEGPVMRLKGKKQMKIGTLTDKSTSF